MNARLSSIAFSLTLLGVAACGTEADPAEVHGRLDRTVPSIVDTTAAIADKVSPADLAAVPSGLGALAGLVDASALPAASPATGPAAAVGIRDAAALVRSRKMLHPERVEALLQSAVRARAAAGDTIDAPTGADVVKALSENIFTQANYAGDGVYRLPADALCATDETGAVDADCAAEIAAIKPTLRAETDGDDALDLTLVIGSLEPVAIHLEPYYAKATVDLADLGAAIKASSALLDLGSDAEASWAMRGVVSADLDVRTKTIATFATTIDQAIHVSVAGKGIALDSAQAFNVDSAAAKPAFRIQLDSNNLALAGGTAINATTIHIPADDTSPALDVDLPGAAMSWNQTPGKPLLIDASLGNRTTTVKVGGQQAIGIDLNPTYDRALQFTVETEADTGAAIFAVSPALDLRVAIDHAVLGDEAPRFDVTQVGLASAGPALPALRVSTLEDGTDQTEVVAGTLTITTNPAGFGATIAAGQCVGAEERSDDQGSFEVPAAITCQ
ncbi:MAG: hypothetical protein K8W52_21925 [Deltaproteobacteria bacterium]|nr:hypothetical protein [Deltaproteobacteria bacterium]